MIQYTCDLCQRTIDPQSELRYVVRMEVYAATDDTVDEQLDEHDAFVELQEVLQRAEDGDADTVADEGYQHLRFDLCPECRKQVMRNPLRMHALQLDFSEN